MELSSNSLSNEISKGSVKEALSMRRATMEDALSRSASGRRPDVISNEEIHIGDPILDTYKVTSDAIHGGMGSVWRVHHNGWDVEQEVQERILRIAIQTARGLQYSHEQGLVHAIPGSRHLHVPRFRARGQRPDSIRMRFTQGGVRM